jgi:hypothetical protein
MEVRVEVHARAVVVSPIADPTVGSWLAIHDLGFDAGRTFLRHEGDHRSAPWKADSALISSSTWFMPVRTGGLSSPPGVKSIASIR